MAKIITSKWKPSTPAEKMANGFRILGVETYSRSSSHGRSTIDVLCPCCGAYTQAFAWSFAGSGKRCQDCKVYLGHYGAFVTHAELSKNNMTYNGSHIELLNTTP